MLSDAMLKALNEQFTKERQNEVLYQAIGDNFDLGAWHGFAAWAHKQAADEAAHARKIAGYIVDMGSLVEYRPLPAVVPPANNIFQTFVFAYENEQLTTSAIKTLYYLAEAQEDPQTCAFLQPLLLEQVEEEKTLSDAVLELTRAKDNASLLLLDARYGS